MIGELENQKRVSRTFAGVSPEERIAAIRAALEAAGVEFIEQNGGDPGVRLQISDKEVDTMTSKDAAMLIAQLKEQTVASKAQAAATLAAAIISNRKTTEDGEAMAIYRMAHTQLFGSDLPPSIES